MYSVKISAPRQGVAFAPRPAARTQRLQGARLAVRAEAINPDIKKDEPKVVDTMKTSEIKGKGVFCRCWRSGTFPMCDGSHVKHNKDNGDNVGPLIIDNSD